MKAPPVHYAKSGDVHIAYQAVGTGPLDILMTPGSTSNLDLYWEEPSFARFFTALAKIGRLILFDKRGTGLSDRIALAATLEERIDDMRAVLDSAQSSRAIIFGLSEGGTMGILFAATYPDRTAGLVVYGSSARWTRAPDHPWLPPREETLTYLANQEREPTFGSQESLDAAIAAMAPSRSNDAAFKEWFGRLGRSGSSPASRLALTRFNMDSDVRDVLPTIHVPTLVLHQTGDRDVPIESGRYIAKHIPGARLVEFPGIDHMFIVDPEGTTIVLRELRIFARGLTTPSGADRMLTTVLFTDIVDSTRTAAKLGDQEWGKILDQHWRDVRTEIARFQGREVKTLGDGVLATFDGPTRGVRCACAIRDAARSAGIEIRAGVHTGECLVSGNDLQGVAVNLAHRVMERAGTGEVLVSSTVRDLTVGSGIRYRDRGLSSLKGIEGKWNLLEVESGY
jgi:pimeloyl-ACP methyl ester carboxylesterase